MTMGFVMIPHKGVVEWNPGFRLRASLLLIFLIIMIYYKLGNIFFIQICVQSDQDLQKYFNIHLESQKNI